MAKRGGSPLQKREAATIASKLNAVVAVGGSHDIAKVYWKGYLVTQFGIRRGKKSRHGHIPHALFLSEFKTMALANCTMTTDEYFAELQKKNKLPAIVS